MQWVAAQPLSRIVVVVFVVILSGVVVVRDPGPSSSALPAALGVCTLHELEGTGRRTEDERKTTADDDHDLEDDDKDNDNDS